MGEVTRALTKRLSQTAAGILFIGALIWKNLKEKPLGFRTFYISPSVIAGVPHLLYSYCHPAITVQLSSSDAFLSIEPCRFSSRRTSDLASSVCLLFLYHRFSPQPNGQDYHFGGV